MFKFTEIALLLTLILKTFLLMLMLLLLTLRVLWLMLKTLVLTRVLRFPGTAGFRTEMLLMLIEMEEVFYF
jgi:hypothetical protein